MVVKSSDRIAAILPFILILLAGVIGLKSNVDLFSYLGCWELLPPSTDVTQLLPEGDR